MNSTPPFVAQERPDSCALACLRMILMHRGTPVTEDQLIELAAWQPGGLNPEELAGLAAKFNLQAFEQQLEYTAITELVARERYPIVFLHRRPIDKVEMVHAVIPIKVSEKFVTILDPLKGQRRISVRKFEEGRRLIGKWLVVWNSREEGS